MKADDRYASLSWCKGDHLEIPSVNLAELFSRQARSTPDRLAVVTDEQTLSYSELDAAAKGWVRALHAEGVRVGDYVGISLERRPALIPAILGILRAGCAYVPLDPAYPADWLSFIAQDASIRAIVCQEAPAFRLGPQVRIVREKDFCRWVGSTHSMPAIKGEPFDRTAYVIYTSGSTGRPKGVPIRHSAVVNLIEWGRRAYDASELAGVLASTSISFDLSIFEMFLPLATGGTVVLLQNALALADSAPPANVTLINTVPSVMAELVRLEAIPPTVRVVNLAGEPLGGVLVNSIYKHPSVRRVINLYAPTETTTYSTYSEVSEGERLPTIGKPIANTQVYIVDGAGTLVSLGTEGEILIGGAGVAAGYINLPELTKERFVSIPYDDRWPIAYRTGDRGVLRADGQLEFRGRADDQVKVRGHRVELGQIENCILKFPGVADAAVVVQDFGPDDHRLVAFVVPGAFGAQLIDPVRMHLECELPNYLVPTVWYSVETLPRLSNGKLNRRALSASTATKEVTESKAAADSLVEIVIREMAVTLGSEVLDAEENFFALGGDSLMAARLAARLRKALDWDISVASVFLGGAPNRIADEIKRSIRMSFAQAHRVSGADVKQEHISLHSFVQRQMWTFHRIFPESGVHNVSLLLSWDEGIDSDRVREACRSLVLRHPLLTARRINEQLGEPSFDFTGSLDLPLRTKEVADSSEIYRTAEALARQPFSLSREPAWRIVLLRTDGECRSVLLVFHHILIDGASLEILLKDFLDRCAADSSVEQQECPLQRYIAVGPELARLANASSENPQLSRTAVSPSSAPCFLPTDRARVRLRKFTALRAGLQLDNLPFDSLRAVSRAEQVTPYILLLSALSVALAGRSGRSEVIVSSAFSLRDTSVFDGLIGCFVSMLPLRIEVDPGITWRELVRRVNSVVDAARGSRHCAPRVLQGGPQSEQVSVSSSPFPILFGCLPSFGDHHENSFAAVRVEEIASGDVEADLNFQARVGRFLELFVDVRADLFTDHTANSILSEWGFAVGKMVRDMGALLSFEEPSRPRPEGVGSATHSVWSAFERVAGTFPGNLAVRSGNESWTYSELRHRALGVAAELGQAEGHEVCGILCAKPLFAVAALLGVLRSGRCYVPLNEGDPTERLTKMAKIADLRMVISDDEFEAVASSLKPGIRVVNIDHLGSVFELSWRCPAIPDSPAYVLFTSGSMGAPKGVVQNHRNLLHHATTYATRLNLTQGDRLTMMANVAYDAAVMDIFGALLTGASLHVWSIREQGLGRVHDWLSQEGITVFHTTPSVFSAIYASSRPKMKLSAVRFIVLGGEPAPKSVVIWYKRYFAANCSLVNGYGPSESTLATQAIFAADIRYTGRHATLPIGQPVEQTEVALLGDGGDKEAFVGEIELRGRHIFLGYLNSPGDWRYLLSAGDVIRRHRTGDVARRLHNGDLLYLGRKDEQLKIAGVRIEPAEVQLTLLQIDSIAEAFVLVRFDVSGKPILVAYVVAKAGCRLTLRAVRAALREKLPANMHPSTLMIIPAMPLLANGKVDRHALPIPRQPIRRSANRLDEWEQKMGSIWQDVLKLMSRPGSEETFVELGGNSLDAVRVAELTRQALDVEIGASLLLGDMSFSEIVSTLRKAPRPAKGSGSQTTLVPPTVEHLMSAQQQRFWFMSQAYPKGAGNRLLAALFFPGGSDRGLLQEAVDAIVERHDMLRSRFLENGNGGVHRVVDDARESLSIEWQRASIFSVPLTIDHLANGARAPFDLRTQWPIRAYGLATDKGDVLTLVLHHIAADAWSANVLVEDIAAVYAGMKSKQNTLLPPAGSFDLAVFRLQERLDKAREAEQLAFWQNELRGAPMYLQLPSDGVRSVEPTFQALRSSNLLPAKMVKAIDIFCNKHSITRSTVLLSAFAILLSRNTGQEELLIGLPVTLRKLPNEDRVVGPLLNTVAIRCNCRSTCSFTDFASAIRERVNSAIANSDVPFDRVVEVLSPPRDSTWHPIYQASFSYHHQVRRTVSARFDAQAPIEASGGTTTCDVGLTIVEVNDRIRCDLEGALDIIHPRLADRLLEQLVRLLESLLSLPEEPIGRAQFIPKVQRRELVMNLNQSRQDSTASASLLALFDQQVARVATAPAVIAPDKTLSYGQLDYLVSALGAKLASLEIGPGDFIPVSVRASADLVVAFLGVLSTGAAFVPVDPSWPSSLLSQVMRDTGARVVLGELNEDFRGITTLDLAIGESTSSRTYRCERLGESPTYAIYTSGTTGTPKAAVVPDRGILNRFAWMARFFGETTPVTLQTTPAIYDSAVWQLLWPLTRGGSCIVPERSQLLDTDLLTEQIARNGVNVIDFVPSLLVTMLPDLELSQKLRCRLEGIRWVILGGESLRPTVAQRVRNLLPKARVVNLYGPTEASIGCIYYEILDQPRERVPIGRPIPNVQVLLLDSGFQLVPRGAIGEVWLIGDCVGLGYLGDHEQSGFRAAPILEFAGRPAFRTGDLARWNERGFLEFYGRLDRQLKIRGIRVEPSGIEAVIERHEAVLHSSVVVQADPSTGQDMLIAYVKMVDGKESQLKELRRWLRGVLPASSVPDLITGLATIPITASGKQDRTLLAATVRGVKQTKPSVGVRARLAGVWTKVLPAGVAVVGDANFFEIGGHSLLLLTLRRELEKEFGYVLPIVEFFRYPTVNAQAELIEHLMSDDPLLGLSKSRAPRH